MQKQLSELVQEIREGGHTERAHTLPHHGSYSVAAHSWHVAMLVVCLHPDPSAALLKACLTHDVPERWVGDTPAMAKWTLNPALGKELKATEAAVEKMLGIDWELTPTEKLWLNACDVLEFMLWCDDQIKMGNVNAVTAYANAREWLSLNHRSLPPEVVKFVNSYKWNRTNDQGWWHAIAKAGSAFAEALVYFRSK